MTTVDGSSLRQRSTLGLVKDLTHQASTLVHQEVELVKLEVHENIELVKQEVAEKGKTAGMGVAALAAAGGAALLALGAFTAFLVLALDGIMPNWLAALCAALLWVVVAIPLALYGRKKIDQVGTPVPKRTIESVKEDVEWLKHQNS
jgi:MFS-type transporter involved in bile tolerance (Atg22 family)